MLCFQLAYRWYQCFKSSLKHLAKKKKKQSLGTNLVTFRADCPTLCMKLHGWWLDKLRKQRWLNHHPFLKHDRVVLERVDVPKNYSLIALFPSANPALIIWSALFVALRHVLTVTLTKQVIPSITFPLWFVPNYSLATFACGAVTRRLVLSIRNKLTCMMSFVLIKLFDGFAVVTTQSPSSYSFANSRKE